MFLFRVLLVSSLLVASALANNAEGQLNHYSDYGVVEQNQSVTSPALNITDDPFGYSDEYTDNESGLQYLQVRYYDPLMMRFTQMDTYPLLNRYAYANENPIMDDDPSGHNAIAASAGATGALLGTGMAISAALGISSVVEMNPVNIIVLVLFSSEGWMSTLGALDNHLSTSASKHLSEAISVLDAVVDFADTGDAIVGLSGHVTDEVKTGSFFFMRVFTDVEPATNDILSIATINHSDNSTSAKLETQLSIINQIVGFTSYFTRGVDEVSEAYEKGYGMEDEGVERKAIETKSRTMPTDASSTNASQQLKPVPDNGLDVADEREDQDQNNISNQEKQRVANRNILLFLARRGTLMSFRIAAMVNDAEAVGQEEKN